MEKEGGVSEEKRKMRSPSEKVERETKRRKEDEEVTFHKAEVNPKPKAKEKITLQVEGKGKESRQKKSKKRANTEEIGYINEVAESRLTSIHGAAKRGDVNSLTALLADGDANELEEKTEVGRGKEKRYLII